MESIVREYANRARAALGPRLRRLVLFGSRARGDASQGSDYDVLLLVDERTPDLEDALLDLGAAMLDQHGALFAAVVRSEREWSDAQGFPLAMNIVREGLAL